MTQAWKTMVADAVRKPPAQRSPLEIEAIRVSLQLTWLGQRLNRLMQQENDDEISEEEVIAILRDHAPGEIPFVQEMFAWERSQKRPQ